MVVKLFKLFIVSVLFGGEFSILRRGIGGFLVGKEDVYEVVNFIDTYGAIPFFFTLQVSFLWYQYFACKYFL